MAAAEHISKFRCLTLARIAASVVVLAFSATVVVVVLIDGLSPVNARLSLTYGHIQSTGLLWSSKDFRMQRLRSRINETFTFYMPAKELSVWVSMNAHDPTRRAANVCVDAIHVLDMPHAPFFDGMVDIAIVNNTVATGNPNKPCAAWRHPGSASMQLDRRVTLHDPLMLCYLSQKYGGINDFTAMLKVDMRILYPKEADYKDTHYCWPVTIGSTRSTRSESVTCKPSNGIGIDYDSNAPVLNACDHLTETQRYMCAKWGNVKINCAL